jgi:putative membrane protein insertion efficiency factor
MPFQSFATRALRAYKRFISPLLLSSCRFTPTCSEYAIEAVERHGIFFGSLLSIWRILRCNPLSHGGLDTVPTELSGSAGVSGASSPPAMHLQRQNELNNQFLSYSRKI